MIYRRFLIVIVSAFLSRAGFLLLVGSEPHMYLTPDSPVYFQLAKNLIHEHQFTASETVPFTPDTIRTPGYPLFLTPFFSNDQPNTLAVVWAQALLGALTAGLLFLTARTLWRTPTAAWVAGLGLAFDYVIILYSAFIMTEALFLLIYVTSLLFFARFLKNPSDHRSLALSGLTSGLCSLVRPVNLYQFLIPAFVLFWMGRSAKNAGTARRLVLFLTAALFLPAAWVVRNKVTAGAWTFTTIQGVTRAAILEERLSHKTFYEACDYLEQRFKDDHPAGFATPAQEASAKSAWSMAYISKYPADYAVVLAQEMIRLIGGNGMKASAWMLFKDPRYNPETIAVHPTDGNVHQVQTLWSNHPMLGLTLVIYLALLALLYLFAATGAVAGFKEEKFAVAWLTLIAVYFLLVSIGFGTGARYRIPIMPSLFLLAGLGCEKLIERIKDAKH